MTVMVRKQLVNPKWCKYATKWWCDSVWLRSTTEAHRVKNLYDWFLKANWYWSVFSRLSTSAVLPWQFLDEVTTGQLAEKTTHQPATGEIDKKMICGHYFLAVVNLVQPILPSACRENPCSPTLQIALSFVFNMLCTHRGSCIIFRWSFDEGLCFSFAPLGAYREVKYLLWFVRSSDSGLPNALYLDTWLSDFLFTDAFRWKLPADQTCSDLHCPNITGENVAQHLHDLKVLRTYFGM